MTKQRFIELNKKAQDMEKKKRGKAHVLEVNRKVQEQKKQHTQER